MPSAHATAAHTLDAPLQRPRLLGDGRRLHLLFNPLGVRRLGGIREVMEPSAAFTSFLREATKCIIMRQRAATPKPIRMAKA